MSAVPMLRFLAAITAAVTFGIWQHHALAGVCLLMILTLWKGWEP